MSSPVRWRYLRRLVAAVVVVVVAQVALAHYLEYRLIRSGERKVGAKIEVADTRVSFVNRLIALRNICVANPVDPMRNLVVADRCILYVEPGPLLHKQTVVRHGMLSGIRFGTERITSGALGEVDDGGAPTSAWFNAESTNAARVWLDHVYAKFQAKLVDQLESIRLTDELLDRWPQQSADVEGRVTEIKRRTNEFQNKVHLAHANPLRHVDFLDNLSDEVEKLRVDVTMLSHEVESLPAAADADRRAIVAARQHDDELLGRELQFEKIDPNALTAYLLQEQLAGPLSDLMGWIRWARRVVPADSKEPTADDRRGQNIVFPGCRRVPDFLVRSLDLRGSASFGGEPVEIAGTLTDLSNRPAWHDQPIRLRLTAGGELPLEVQATIDRTGPVAKDQLLVDCGSIMLPKLRLGSSEKLRLSLQPTTATLNVSITLEGDRLSGEIQLVHKQVQISPSVGPELEQVRLADALEESLGDVHSVATRISLRGTLEEPEWELWSNLGPAVAEAMENALAHTAQAHARQVLADAQERVNRRLAQYDRQVSDEQAELEPQLAGSTDALDQLADGKTRSAGLSQEQLGRLPENSLFR